MRARTTPDGGCWLWTGKRNQQGYGRLRVDGRDVLAHRHSWALVNGRISEGLCVLHRCDRPACINPAHLFIGTIADNNADMKSKGRGRKATGEAHPWVKLTTVQVLEIRRRRANGEMLKDMAVEFGVHPAHLSKVTRNLSRRHDGVM